MSLQDSTPKDMWESDSLKRFVEGLKLAVSCTRELQSMEPKMGWGKVTEGLQNLLISGRKLAQAKAMTRQALLVDAARIQGKLDTSKTA